MADRRKRRVHDIVEQSKYWNAEDLLRNLEDEMRRLEQGLGHVIFDSEGRPVTMCVSPLPMTPKFETKRDGDEFTVKAHLPGVEKDDLRLAVERDSIVVRGISGKKNCRPYYLSVDTPWSVDSESAQVKFEAGILTVKAKKLKKTRVPVK